MNTRKSFKIETGINIQKKNIFFCSKRIGDKTLNVVAVASDGDLKRWENFY